MRIEYCFFYGKHWVNGEQRKPNMIICIIGVSRSVALLMNMFTVLFCRMMGSGVYNMGKNNLMTFTLYIYIYFFLVSHLSKPDGISVTFKHESGTVHPSVPLQFVRNNL